MLLGDCRTSACLAQSLFNYSDMLVAPRNSHKGEIDFKLGFSSTSKSYTVTPLVEVNFTLLDEDKVDTTTRVEAAMCFASPSAIKPVSCISHMLRNVADTYWVDSWYYEFKTLPDIPAGKTLIDTFEHDASCKVSYKWTGFG